MIDGQSDDDYFGINDLPVNDTKIKPWSESPNETNDQEKVPQSDVKPSLIKPPFKNNLLQQPKNSPNRRKPSFGTVRYDRDNKVQFHGQYEQSDRSLKIKFADSLPENDIDYSKEEKTTNFPSEYHNETFPNPNPSFGSKIPEKRQNYARNFDHQGDDRHNQRRDPFQKRPPFAKSIDNQAIMMRRTEKWNVQEKRHNHDEDDGTDPENMTAFEVVESLKQSGDDEIERIKKVDCDGSLLALHMIWSKIPKLYEMTQDEILDLLVKSVLHNEDDFIVLNKPYGLPCIGGKGVKYSLSSFLEPLRKRLAPNAKRLYLAHRLDKSTTGALMLTACEERQNQIKKMLHEKTLTKRYLCLVRGIIQPPEGIINVPLGECEVLNRFRMIPLARKTAENSEVVRNDSRMRYEAVTEFKTLQSANGCSLVQTNIITGVKHQIRSHLGLCMNRPILGDSKYTDMFNYKPQRLAPETLHCLGIRASRSRDLPIYLHAREIVLPEFMNGRNLIVKAPLPDFFVYTMKKLRLKL